MKKPNLLKKPNLYVMKRKIGGQEVLLVPLNEKFSSASFSKKNETWKAMQRNIFKVTGLKGTVVLLYNTSEGVSFFCPFFWQDLIKMRELTPIL
jgi:hypothetical protein